MVEFDDVSLSVLGGNFVHPSVERKKYVSNLMLLYILSLKGFIAHRCTKIVVATLAYGPQTNGYN